MQFTMEHTASENNTGTSPQWTFWELEPSHFSLLYKGFPHSEVKKMY